MLPWGAGREKKGKKLIWGGHAHRWSSHDIVLRVYITWVGQELSNLDVVLPDSALRHLEETIGTSENHHNNFSRVISSSQQKLPENKT